MANKIVKKRNWAFVCYPESLPLDWLDILRQTGLPCAISPLHDSDINADGEPKKPHFHVIVCYSGPTSYNVVKCLTDRLNAPPPQALEQVRGYYRYLTHKDNPEKFQYSASNIQCLNGFCISDYCDLTASEVMAYKKQIQQMIRELNITEYADLMDILLDSEMSDQYDIASNNTYFFNQYIASRRHSGRYPVTEASSSEACSSEASSCVGSDSEHDSDVY